MNKYQRGKIYKIVSDLTDDVYIGSTTEPTLARRLVNHRRSYQSYVSGKGHFITAYKILETGDYDIVLLENYPCNNKDELHARERYYIENTDNCVNKVVPTRTKIEYRRDNAGWYKEYLKEYNTLHCERLKKIKRIYYETNKDKLSEQRKAYREANKDRLSGQHKAYREANKDKLSERHKAYREANKEAIREKKKQYRETNKETIAQHKAIKMICECGSEHRINDKARHLRTQKHQNYIKSLTE